MAVRRLSSRWIAAYLALAGTALLAFSRGDPFCPPTSLAHGVVADPWTVDIHAAEGGQPQTASFELKNTGRRQVRIEGVSTSCGCTLAEPLAKAVLDSGASTVLKVRATPPAFGVRPVSVQVALKSGDKRESLSLQLNLRGRNIANERVLATPRDIELLSADPTIAHREFEIVTVEEAGKEPLLIKFDSSDPAIVAELLDFETTVVSAKRIQRTYRCRMSGIIPDSVGKWHTAEVHLVVSRVFDAPLPSIRIALQRHADFHVAPAVVNVSKDEAGSKEWMCRVVILATDPKNAESLARLEVDFVPPGVTTRWHRQMTADKRILEVSFSRPDASDGTIDRIVARDQETEKQITIPIVWEATMPTIPQR